MVLPFQLATAIPSGLRGTLIDQIAIERLCSVKARRVGDRGFRELGIAPRFSE